jgi:aspartyl-tRNA(Asn)/glutamyl-tRNA(Gln) amidotransferase subunit B
MAQPVIGLEIHIQLNTQCKLFCTCPNTTDAPPNHNTCPICSGYPGALPILNMEAVQKGLKLAVALRARVNRISQFDRKHYFYGDLPKGYQITQYFKPLSEEGRIEISDPQSPLNTLFIPISRLHLEEDAGKMIHNHTQLPLEGSLLDLNRSGVPLIELVTAPVFHSPATVDLFLKSLRSLVRYLNISDGDMEKGSLRCDANISVRPSPTHPFGNRVELKNLNSFRYIKQALRWEIKRQTNLMEQGKPILQETRSYDPKRNETYSIRAKESTPDYRYCPDPDLPHIHISDLAIEEIRHLLPMLPTQVMKTCITEYQLTPEQAYFFIDYPIGFDFFILTVSKLKKETPSTLANWIIYEIKPKIPIHTLSQDTLQKVSTRLVSLLELLSEKRLTRIQAQHMIPRLIEPDGDPVTLLSENTYTVVTDLSTIQPLIDKLLEEHPNQVAAFRAGKTGVLGFFMGLLMKQTQGQVDPTALKQELEFKLHLFKHDKGNDVL